MRSLCRLPLPGDLDVVITGSAAGVEDLYNGRKVIVSRRLFHDADVAAAAAFTHGDVAGPADQSTVDAEIDVRNTGAGRVFGLNIIPLDYDIRGLVDAPCPADAA